MTELSPEPDHPHPPRFYWLKRLSASASLTLLLVAGLWTTLAWRADRRLGDEFARYRSLGQPVLPTDFDATAVPDADNAAPVLFRAPRAIKTNSLTDDDWNKVGPLWPDRPIPDDEIAPLTRLAEAVAPARELVRSARPKKSIDWGLRTHGSVRNPTSLANNQEFLGDLILKCAFLDHHRGDQAAAIEALRDGLFISRAIQCDIPTTGTHFYALRMTSRAANYAAAFATEIELHATNSTTRPATPSQIRGLINDLLDDQPLLRHGLRSLYAERLTQREDAQVAGRANALRPFFAADALNAVRGTSIAIDAASKDTWPAASAKLPPPHAPLPYSSNRPSLSQLAHPYYPARYGYATPEESVRGEFQALATRRIAASALAIRLYREDHAGQFPTRLDDLVPDYLPAVPIDPFSPDHHPLRYVPDSPNPYIYSVGEDATDDRGSEQWITPPDHPPESFFPWSRRDAVFHLLPGSKLGPPTRPAVP